MTADHLPDDMADWPNDPFALLGVPPGSADADVKRAYTRLVRRFKPEHHPDQFRRIREAYEACQERNAWYRPDPREYSPPPPPPPREVVREPVIDPQVRPSDSAEPPEPVIDPYVLPAPAGDPVEELWELAIDGREAEAYSGLADLHAAGTAGDTLPLRLYWLLAFNPKLDTTRTRHHWLADALARTRFRGPPLELYRRELETDPVAALEPPDEPGPYFRALSSGIPPAAAVAAVRWRIAAAGRLGWTARIRADLDVVRPLLVLSDEATWLGLLVTAGGWAAWWDGMELNHVVTTEAAALAHLQLSQSEQFDRLEEIERLAKDVEWGRYSEVPAAVLALARIAFADPGYARAAEVEAAAAALNGWSAEVLRDLDRTFVKRPAQLNLIAREFDHYLRARGLLSYPEFPPDHLRGLARRVRLPTPLDYRPFRRDLLDLLAENGVHPLEFAAALADDPKRVYRDLADALQGDLGLFVAWLALRITGG
jgi:HAMP domain-containing protein